MTEFNLSEKILYMESYAIDQTEALVIEDVKEFIRLLKEKINNDIYSYAGKKKAIGKGQVIHIIDKLAGDKLK